MKSNPLVLVILDGFGSSKQTQYNAIAQAKKPMIDYLLSHYPHTVVKASGKAVGLPDGYAGNSEVGHTTIGAGRIIVSPFLHFYETIASGKFFSNPILVSHLNELASSNKTLHILGLLSDAGNQCHQDLIFALIKAGIDHAIKKIVVHAFLDGRDVPPKSAADYLQALQQRINHHQNVSLGSITGRYYAMDRNNHWDRTQEIYTMLTQSIVPQFKDWQQALVYYYGKEITDEFIPPTLLNRTDTIADGDGIVFANFREDRARQLTEAFIMPKQTPLQNRPLSLRFFISAIRYGKQFKNPVLFKVIPAANTLKQVLSDAHKTLFTIAETEKYAHVTYFFADGREQPFKNETRVLIPSLLLKNYSEHPQMSAPQITDAVIHSLQTKPCDFYLINYANADMVGHSGNLPATIQAVECLDNQIKQLYEQVVKKMDGILCITADHGNAEIKFDTKTGQPHTGHTTNPVPFLFIKNDLYNKKIELPLHGLADVAPFILENMHVAVPPEMRHSSHLK